MFVKIKNKSKGRSLQIQFKIPVGVFIGLVVIGLSVFSGIDSTSLLADMCLAPAIFSELPYDSPAPE